jgi:hypothetical protein
MAAKNNNTLSWDLNPAQTNTIPMAKNKYEAIL